MNIIAKTAKLLLLTAFSAVLLAGCQTKLDPGGVYNSDTFLYNADKTLSVAKAGLQQFVEWEFKNRATITNTWPQVTVAADKVREQAPQAFALAGIARTSYIQVKTSIGSNTNSLALTSAKEAFQNSVEAIGQQVNNANNASALTTLSSRPTIKLPTTQ